MVLLTSFQQCSKRGLEHEAPVARYYERLVTVSVNGVVDLVPAVQQAWAGARGAGGPLLRAPGDG